MKNNEIYLVPGPTTIPTKIRKFYQQNFGSPDLESDFFELYKNCEKTWQTILATKNNVVVMTGEAMLGLWGALKSTIKPKDKVLALANGLFSDGIAEMAKTLGANVKTLHFPYNNAITDFAAVEKAIQKFQPKIITMVHCETPTGILNPLAEIGALKKKYGVPLFYVDAVASIGGTPIEVDKWHIDLCLGGGQKAPSIFSDITFLAVSKTAWKIINEVNYAGYDALKSFQNAVKNSYFPYTPHWPGIAALNASGNMLLKEGLKNVFVRHKKIADFCRKKILELGLELFPENLNYASPTVTAIKVPKNISWEKLNKKLRDNGVIFGGNYGTLQNKVFRIGHMGTQADMILVKKGLIILERILR